ncbi:MAG TPA: UDP-3-O-acyl-N-acetylglucosamine deacetylase [Thermoanaerobaculia bacterium]|nr:UDP-3-O-acyl-N-acetylglucosamine deacetylase [Thermoanaerobaculia bacterium]
MTNKPDDFFVQKTIARPVSISGIGIHSGKEVRLQLQPAPADSGVRFRRVDRGVEVPALASFVSSLELATTLGRDDVQVSTVEHLMAAIQVLGIDNLLIEIDGPEVPILDGSALPYCRLLEAADVQPQRALRRILAITAPFEINESAGRAISITPYPGLRVSYRIDFGDRAIGAQSVDVEVTREGFLRELAPARTFALLRDVSRMLERGLALGGDEGNCVVYDEAGPINTVLRFPDEPVRHKALDAIGDLALLGSPIWGHLTVERGGHALHLALLEALQARPECWTWVAGETMPIPSRAIAAAGGIVVPFRAEA